MFVLRFVLPNSLLLADSSRFRAKDSRVFRFWPWMTDQQLASHSKWTRLTKNRTVNLFLQRCHTEWDNNFMLWYRRELHELTYSYENSPWEGVSKHLPWFFEESMGEVASGAPWCCLRTVLRIVLIKFLNHPIDQDQGNSWGWRVLECCYSMESWEASVYASFQTKNKRSLTPVIMMRCTVLSSFNFLKIKLESLFT